LSNVLVTGCPGVKFPVSNEGLSSAHPLSGVGATPFRLCGGPAAVVHVTVPPTFIVVTGVPLASSCHFKPTFFTVAVVGAGGVGAGVGVVFVFAVVVGAGVFALVVLAPLFWLCCVHEVKLRSKTVVSANPRTFRIVSSSFILGLYLAGKICWLCDETPTRLRRK
jgi:hypothetical protein